MMGHRAVITTVLMVLALASAGEAQDPVLVPGVRVRVTGPCLADLPSGPAQCAVVVGRLRSWTSDSVIVQDRSGAERAVARSGVRLVEVSDFHIPTHWIAQRSSSITIIPAGNKSIMAVCSSVVITAPAVPSA